MVHTIVNIAATGVWAAVFFLFVAGVWIRHHTPGSSWIGLGLFVTLLREAWVPTARQFDIDPWLVASALKALGGLLMLLGVAVLTVHLSLLKSIRQGVCKKLEGRES